MIYFWARLKLIMTQLFLFFQQCFRNVLLGSELVTWRVVMEIMLKQVICLWHSMWTQEVGYQIFLKLNNICFWNIRYWTLSFQMNRISIKLQVNPHRSLSLDIWMQWTCVKVNITLYLWRRKPCCSSAWRCRQKRQFTSYATCTFR